jgi:hypothetical protein
MRTVVCIVSHRAFAVGAACALFCVAVLEYIVVRESVREVAPVSLELEYLLALLCVFRSIVPLAGALVFVGALWYHTPVDVPPQARHGARACHARRAG